MSINRRLKRKCGGGHFLPLFFTTGPGPLGNPPKHDKDIYAKKSLYCVMWAKAEATVAGSELIP